MEFFYPQGANLYLDRIQLRNPPPHSVIEGERKVVFLSSILLPLLIGTLSPTLPPSVLSLHILFPYLL
jgi:hypothetical protein